MRQYRGTIAPTMVLIAFVAIDCLAAQMTRMLAGWWTLGCALEVGIVLMLWDQRESRRRFWTGFLATGFGFILTSIGVAYFELRSLQISPYRILETYYRLLQLLPIDLQQWCSEHDLVFAAGRPVPVAVVVISYEFAYGLPMLLMAILGGTLLAWRKPGSARRPISLAA